jgi:hypothetical protein
VLQYLFKKNHLISSFSVLIVVCVFFIYFIGLGQNSYCENSCELYGQCTFEDGVCVARGNDCLTSAECKIYGLCSPQKGLCKAISDHSCALSEVCLLQGKCEHSDGVCKATSKGCLNTPRCTKFGWCSEVNGSCIAKNDSDCSQSLSCIDESKCLASGGHCIVSTK